MDNEKFEILAANPENAKRLNSTKYDNPDYRDAFDRDRDRILYSKAFRRLGGKTQVFVQGYDDHVRTRLTHTLEVSQIAQTISKALGLNIILTEAIALGHDIGHTPFGHVGEEALNLIMNGCDKLKKFNKDLRTKNQKRGFKHNYQGLKIALNLENSTDKENGLNLTNYSLFGILYHTKLRKKCKVKDTYPDKVKCFVRGTQRKGPDCFKKKLYYDYYRRLYKKVFSEEKDIINAFNLEALVVNIADEIAQRHHDIEDGLEAEILKKENVISKINMLFESDIKNRHKNIFKKINANMNDKDIIIPLLSKFIVDFLVTKVIENSKKNLKKIIKKYTIKNGNFHEMKSEILKKYITNDQNKFYFSLENNFINYSDEFIKKEEEFQSFLKNRILNSHIAQMMDGKAKYIIRQLFKAYLTNPQQLPDKTIKKLYEDLKEEQINNLCSGSNKKTIGEIRNIIEKQHILRYDGYNEVLLRLICDYIAGMTDSYALDQYNLLYGTKYNF